AEDGIRDRNVTGVQTCALPIFLASRDIVGGIEWVAQQKDKENIDKLAEKQKKQFAGCEISGKKLGIIGLGAIGALVANSATHLEIGRASWRERVERQVGAGTCK